jgi:hypothetical protein
MSPAAALAHPAAASAATSPDGTDGDSGSSRVVLDVEKGVVVTGDSRVQQASFGSGALVLHQVHAAVAITNSGSPHADITTTVGDASVGGVPVSIGKDGVVVGPQVVPLDQVQAASAALNGALANAGVSVSALAPQITTSDSQETISATAVSVSINNAGPPQQTVIYNLGNIFADDLAVPTTPALPSLDTGSVGGGGDVTATTLTPPASVDTGSSTATSVSPPVGVSPPFVMIPQHPKKPIGAAPAGVTLAAKPAWLLAAYLVWQALIIATLASLWWWRSASRRLPTPGSRP